MSNTPYDDVFRTMLNDCKRLVIPVINEAFHEHYTGDEEILFFPNEHYLNQQDGREVERITDTSFVIQGKVTKKYHWECQSTTDSSMLIRIFEYDAQIALDAGEVKEDVLTVEFPNSAILYLRSNPSTPDYMKIRIKTPGGEVCYNVPTMKVQKYTIQDIFDKQLLFLIPFYIFTHESHFPEYDKDESKLETLKEEYEYIKDRLEQLCNSGVIEEYTKCMIIDMSNKVIENLTKKYDKVKKGVESVMVGRVLEYEAKTIYNEGVSQGKAEMLLDLVRDGMLSIEEAARRLQISEEEIEMML